MNRLISVLVIAGSSLVMSGCISYTHQKLQPMQTLQSATQMAPHRSLYLRVTGEHFANGSPVDEKNITRFEKAIVAAYKKSGLFETVRTEQAKSDVYADVVLTINEKYSAPLVFMCGFTLLAIPCSGDSSIAMQTTFKDGNGNATSKIEKQETLTVWMHLLLIFGLPFQVSEEKIFESLVRTTLDDALNKGVI